jgi:hypothetical protein
VGRAGLVELERHEPRKEFCEFVVQLVELTRPSEVIETGIGQGFLARRIKPRHPRILPPEPARGLRRREARLADLPV